MKTTVDLTSEKDIHWSQDISYSTYLSLEPLLNLQKPLSGQHDEMLFIIIHQTSELWMKCCLHELNAAMDCLKTGQLNPAFKMLARIKKIQANMQQSWQILSTMTPADYESFRSSLGQSSGFQSVQYRALEFMLGNKNAGMIKAHMDGPHATMLQNIVQAPSFYDLALQALHSHGHHLPDHCLDRDFSQPYVPSKDVEQAWLAVYKNPSDNWDLYELAEKMVDLEQEFHLWRFAHMKTVERIIGFKQGTGGTGGVSYLVKALDIRFFPELWTMRTSI